MSWQQKFSYLDDQGSIIGATSSESILEARPVLISVFDLLGKQLGVEHRGVAQISAIAATQDPPSEL